MFLIRKFMLYQFLAHLCLIHGSGFTEEQYVANLRKKLERYDKQVEFYTQFRKTKENTIENAKIIIAIWKQEISAAYIRERCNNLILILDQEKTHVISEQSTANERKKDNELILKILCMAETTLEKMKNTVYKFELKKRLGVSMKNWDLIVSEENVIVWDRYRKYLLSTTGHESNDTYKTPIDFTNSDNRILMNRQFDSLSDKMWSCQNVIDIRNELKTYVEFFKYYMYRFMFNLMVISQNKLCTVKRCEDNRGKAVSVCVIEPENHMLTDSRFQNTFSEKLNMLLTVFYGPFSPTDDIHNRYKPQAVDKSLPQDMSEYQDSIIAKKLEIFQYNPYKTLSHVQTNIKYITDLCTERAEHSMAIETLEALITKQKIQKEETEKSIVEAKKLLKAL